MKPLSPKPGKGWIEIEDFCATLRLPAEYMNRNGSAWQHPTKQIFVLSSFDTWAAGGRNEYHLSISTGKGRGTDKEVMRTLREFGMNNAYEDNSGSTAAHVRHFWQAVKATHAH